MEKFVEEERLAPRSRLRGFGAEFAHPCARWYFKAGNYAAHVLYGDSESPVRRETKRRFFAAKCEHGYAWRSICPTCNGCFHGKLKYNCKVCNGCPHGKLKSNCADCTGCPHGKRKDNCAKCNGCPHGKRKQDCAKCNPCPHGKVKRYCTTCTGCEHGKRKGRCPACKAAREGQPAPPRKRKRE